MSQSLRLPTDEETTRYIQAGYVVAEHFQKKRAKRSPDWWLGEFEHVPPKRLRHMVDTKQAHAQARVNLLGTHEAVREMLKQLTEVAEAHGRQVYPYADSVMRHDHECALMGIWLAEITQILHRLKVQ